MSRPGAVSGRGTARNAAARSAPRQWLGQEAARISYPLALPRSCPIGDDHMRLIELRTQLGDTEGAFFKLNGVALTRARALHLVVRPRLDSVLRGMASRDLPQAPTAGARWRQSVAKGEWRVATWRPEEQRAVGCGPVLAGIRAGAGAHSFRAASTSTSSVTALAFSSTFWYFCSIVSV